MSATFKWRLAQGLEIRWWKRYLKGRDVEEYLAWKRTYWRTFLKPLDLEIPSDYRILDVGCGPAGIFTIFKPQDVIAIDPLIDRYEKELPHFDPSRYPNARFISAGIESFETDESFDLVFCLNAINHVSDLDEALDNLFQLMKPESNLVISIDCHQSSILKRLFRLIPGDMLHPHQHDLDDYGKMIEARGGTIRQTHLSKPGKIFDYYVLVVSR